MRRIASPFLLLALTVAACQSPPPSAYVGGGYGTEGKGIGTNAAGEACTVQAVGGGSDIFCGTYTRPSGHVASGGPVAAGGLAAQISRSAWRGDLEARFVCQEPTPTTILGDAPALLLQCTQRSGGWPHVALAADVGGTAWLADGILPALPVVERAIGVASGRVAPEAAPRLPPSQADALAAARLAASSFGAGDVAQYERLMLAGTRANLAEDFASAEAAYRAALDVQRKALGPRAPDTALPLTLIALQLSDQGQFAAAEPLFAEAAPRAARAADLTVPAKLLHYRALHAINEKRFDEALGLLRQADAAYAALLPSEALTSKPGSGVAVLARAGGATRRDPLPRDDVVLDPTQQAALIGLIETRRYEAIALRSVGRPAEAEQALTRAAGLAAAHGFRQPRLTARLYRTAAEGAGASGDLTEALASLGRASDAFNVALPGSRPLATTKLLAAAQLLRQGDEAGAGARCDEASALLQDLRAGVDPELIAPCLKALDKIASIRDDAGRQAVWAKMFTLAQLGQDSVTIQQIAQSTARLAAGSRDPRAAEAIRQRQDAAIRVAELTQRRDQLRSGNPAAEGDAPSGSTLSAEELDKQIAEASRALTDADGAVQSAAPNFGQLVSQVMPASDVMAALTPGEAFLLLTLETDGGWTFAIRDGRLTVARTPMSRARATTLVQHVRASIEEPSATPRYDAEDARALYDETLRPVEGVLHGATQVVVAPVGPLLSIPFSILLTGPADGANLVGAPFLVRQFAITHVPSPGNFVALRKVAGTSRASRPWFGMGDFHPVTLAQAQKTFPAAACADSAKLFAGLPPLPSARRELETARTLLGAGTGDELEGAAFTAAAVQRAPLADYRVIHFAAHALLPAELRCQSEPAIVTSPPPGAADANGALLTSSEIVYLRLDANVVILSACNTGGPASGPDAGTGGESLSGLARSFFYGGARALMVTHWSVNDAAAGFLVTDTLRRVRSGTPEERGMAGALRGAELALLGEAGKSLPVAAAHPAIWAPFAVVGEGGAGRSDGAVRAEAPRQTLEAARR